MQMGDFQLWKTACAPRLMQLLQRWDPLHGRPKVARSSQPRAGEARSAAKDELLGVDQRPRNVLESATRFACFSNQRDAFRLLFTGRLSGECGDEQFVDHFLV